MNKYRVVLQCAGVFGGVLLILWLFLTVSAAIPNSRIQKNMEKSAGYYTMSEPFAYCDGEKMNGIADNYADSIWINVAWYMGKGNPVVSSIDTKYYDGEQKGQNVGLYLAVTEDDTEANTDYTRYWHGTAGIVRILHLFTDVNGIKYMGFIATLSLAAVIMILLIKDGKDMVAIAFFLSLCIVKIWNIRLSMEYQPAFIVGFLLCILYLLHEKKGNQSLLPLAAASGAVISFFDFLTTETVVILLPLILVITVRALDGRIGEWKENMIFIIVQGIVWLVSYGMMFPVKWGIASVVTGENKFAEALNLAEERMNGTVHIIGDESRFPQIFAAPAANLTVLFGGTERIEDIPLIAGIMFLVIFFIIFIVCMLKTGKESQTANITLKTEQGKHIISAMLKAKQEKQTATAILFVLGFIIILRYMVLNNHSYLHAFFTYRGMISLIMAMLSMILLHIRKEFKDW